jgi:hypothetical protein
MKIKMLVLKDFLFGFLRIFVAAMIGISFARWINSSTTPWIISIGLGVIIALAIQIYSFWEKWKEMGAIAIKHKLEMDYVLEAIYVGGMSVYSLEYVLDDSDQDIARAYIQFKVDSGYEGLQK